MAIEQATALGIGVFGLMSYLWYDTIDAQLLWKWQDKHFQIGSWYKFIAQFMIYLSGLLEIFYLAENSASMGNVFGVIRNVYIVFFTFITLLNVIGMVMRVLVIPSERGGDNR